MSKMIEKVTAFVLRKSGARRDLLLFEHPYAGIQIPAGTVNPGESPQDAVLREVREETGLTRVRIVESLGFSDERLSENQRVIIPPAEVYARPDRASFDWITIRSAVQVAVNRTEGEFSQITYIEYNQAAQPNSISMQITGWASDADLAETRRRHFFLLEFSGQSEDRWTVFADHHTFTPFWAPMTDLQPIIPPQDDWLQYLKAKI